MKCFPVDTFKNNRSTDNFLCRELFAYPPGLMDSNHIMGFRRRDTGMFFRRLYRESRTDFRFAKNTRRDLQKMK